MFYLEFTLFGLIIGIQSSPSDSLTQNEKCVAFTNKSNCNGFNITCSDYHIMITSILFGNKQHTGNANCPGCRDLDINANNLINVSDGRHDLYMNFLLENCNFKRCCSVWPQYWNVYVTIIKYQHIAGESMVDMCDGHTAALNRGDQRQLVLRRSNQSGACSCVINGSTKILVQDFFTVFDQGIGPYNHSSSSLRMDAIVFDNTTTRNIIHSNISHKNVANITITYDEHFQRLWLSVIIIENGTVILCTDLDSSTLSTPTTDVTVAFSTTPATDRITNATTYPANVSGTSIGSTKDVMETATPSLSQTTSTGTDAVLYTSSSGSQNATLVETTKAGQSGIVYIASGSSVVVVVMIVVGIIAVIRYKRRNIPGKSTKVSENGARRSSSESIGFENLAMQSSVNNEYDCQTVAHIPHITKGSVKYALAVPPGPYNYAFTQYDRDVSQKFRFEAEQTGASKSDAKLADGKEGLCHPYFCLHPLNEQGIDTTADGYCTDERDSRGSDGDMITEQPMHVYNHIMFGHGATGVDNASGLICADEYSHISIDGVKASGDGRYYNIVNINAGKSEHVDDYCHIGPNNAVMCR